MLIDAICNVRSHIYIFVNLELGNVQLPSRVIIFALFCERAEFFFYLLALEVLF